jgi:hypothetical protein
VDVIGDDHHHDDCLPPQLRSMPKNSLRWIPDARFSSTGWSK